MKLGSGIAPIPELLARGITVGIGTDGSASNNDMDMFAEMDSASKLQKVHRLDPTALPAPQVLRMATLGGAQVLGMDAKIGSLEPGKAADIIVIEMDKSHWQPLYHLDSQLVYSCKGADVRDTIVNGKILMRDRKILSFDESEVFAHMRRIQAKVLKDIEP
jgi:5-methylthioadenosine/S-adenosylhomocysteine deaminase